MLDLNNPQYYENRELSWLEFNQRVLDEAMNTDNPLFERVKFLSIVSSNLDEFYMVRVASLKEMVNAGYEKEDFSGMTPKQQLKAISERVHIMSEDQYGHLKRALIPQLKKNGVAIIDEKGLSKKQRVFLDDYFTDVIYPVITPLAVDSGRPFPLILNKSLNLAVRLKKDGQELYATVQVPSVLPRMIELPNGHDGSRTYILLETVMSSNIQNIFEGYSVESVHPYRVTRNSDLSLDEEEAEDLLLEIEKSIKMRKWGQAIRLEVDNNIDEKLLIWLVDAMSIHKRDIYKIDGPLDLTFLMKFYGTKGFDQLKYPDFTPQTPVDLLGEEDIFGAIRKKDILLSHPYESFEPVVKLVERSAKDPKVLAIKQTLYRVSGRSPIIHALAEAADNGKQVTVLVELKARFDEENNIQWARRLEESGCHVIYGLVGLKTHSKVTLIVRQEEDGIRRYVHLGTGNYNDSTAKLYTDTAILTCNERIGADVSAVFNAISGYSDSPKLSKIVMAPTGLRDKFYELINREKENALAGREGRIVAKMNSLCDQEMIKVLYEASMAGVKIELIIRGICSLKTGIEGVSDNITVKSIVGKYLEHSRIFCFHNNGNEEIYMSSADWMPRNLDRRVELLFPIEQDNLKQRVKDMLKVLKNDTAKAKVKNKDGSYQKVDGRGKGYLLARAYQEQQAVDNAKLHFEKTEQHLFVPAGADEA